jgi:hypothetical protein
MSGEEEIIEVTIDMAELKKMKASVWPGQAL